MAKTESEGNEGGGESSAAGFLRRVVARNDAAVKVFQHDCLGPGQGLESSLRLNKPRTTRGNAEEE